MNCQSMILKQVVLANITGCEGRILIFVKGVSIVMNSEECHGGWRKASVTVSGIGIATNRHKTLYDRFGRLLNLVL